MKILTRITATIMFLFGSQVVAGPAEDATAAVQKATDVLLTKLVEVQPVYESDPDRFFAEVDSALAPFVDFEGFSRGVMAKYYRRATDDQKQRFEETFRDGLIRTYAKALVEFDNQQVVVKEGTSPAGEPDRASVDIEIQGKGGDVYVVNYSLRNVEGKWMLRNVTIEGINIGLQFRSQFGAYMQQYRNNIDKVIENWTVDVSEA
ncbi:MAG: ABC transporter substrate-binding protein [Pseudomonadales bacterium]|nr:ABC transporter substrate-binding protein [Pseudomonadales bacterium]